MTDECYEAKQWLNRYHHKKRQLNAEKRKLTVLNDRLKSAVARYETDGSKSYDSDAARSRHEEMLLDYSEQKKKVEGTQRELERIYDITLKAINELTDPDHQLIATDRYIMRLRWNDVASLEHISRAQVFRIHIKMLEQMHKILSSGRFYQ